MHSAVAEAMADKGAGQRDGKIGLADALVQASLPGEGMESARFASQIGHAGRNGLAHLFENADELEGRSPRSTIEAQQSIPLVARAAAKFDGCNSCSHS